MRQLNLPVNQVCGAEFIIFIADDLVIDFEAALLNQPASFAFAGNKTEFQKGVQQAQTVNRRFSMLGKSPPAIPCSKVAIAVSLAAVASASPRQIFVASKARIF